MLGPLYISNGNLYGPPLLRSTTGENLFFSGTETGFGSSVPNMCACMVACQEKAAALAQQSQKKKEEAGL